MQTVDYLTTLKAPRDDKALSLAGEPDFVSGCRPFPQTTEVKRLSSCAASIKYSHAPCACRLSDMRLYIARSKAGLLSGCTPHQPEL